MKNLLLVAASIAFTLLLLELGLRIALPVFSNQPDPVRAERHLLDAYRSHRMNPDFATLNETGGETIHSQDGFRRDSTVSLEKPNNTVRIVVFGGSALYGLGSWGSEIYPNHRDLANNETITYFLEKKLNALVDQSHPGIHVEVLNAGHVAYQTFHHLTYLNSEILAYHPDIVINFDGQNDFYKTDPGHRHWMDYYYSSIKTVALINERSFLYGLHLITRSLAQHSALMAQVEKRVTKPMYTRLMRTIGSGRKRGSMMDLYTEYPLLARTTFLRALWQINRLGKREGYDHLVILQPHIVFENPETISTEDKAIREATLKRGVKPAKMLTIRSMLPDLFREEGIPYTDIGAIGDLVTANENLYIDYCHLTPDGSEATATAMLPHVLPLTIARAGAIAQSY